MVATSQQATVVQGQKILLLHPTRSRSSGEAGMAANNSWKLVLHAFAAGRQIHMHNSGMSCNFVANASFLKGEDCLCACMPYQSANAQTRFRASVQDRSLTPPTQGTGEIGGRSLPRPEQHFGLGKIAPRSVCPLVGRGGMNLRLTKSKSLPLSEHVY